MSFIARLTLDAHVLTIEPASSDNLELLRNMPLEDSLAAFQNTLTRIEEVVRRSLVRRCVIPVSASSYPAHTLTPFWSMAEGVLYVFSLASRHCRALTPERCFPIVNTCLASIRQHLNISSEEAETTHPSRQSIPSTSGTKRPAEDSDSDPGEGSSQQITPRLKKQKVALVVGDSQVPGPSRDTWRAILTPYIRTPIIQAPVVSVHSPEALACNCISLHRCSNKYTNTITCNVSVKNHPGNASNFKASLKRVLACLDCTEITFHIPPPEIPLRGTVSNNPQLLCQLLYATVCRNSYFAQRVHGNKRETIQRDTVTTLNALNQHYYSLLSEDDAEEPDPENHHPSLTQFVKTELPVPIPVPNDHGFLWWKLTIDGNSKECTLSKEVRLPTKDKINHTSFDYLTSNFITDCKHVYENIVKFGSISVYCPQGAFVAAQSFLNRDLSRTESLKLLQHLILINHSNICLWFNAQTYLTPYATRVRTTMLAKLMEYLSIIAPLPAITAPHDAPENDGDSTDSSPETSANLNL